MGTNFYFITRKSDHFFKEEREIHIGKRSAAGYYCFNCDVTLCMDGDKGVHQGVSEWYEKCPICGASKKKESLDNSSAGIELGFNKKTTKKKKGVASCSSFNFAYDPLKVIYIIGRNLNNSRKLVKDEYGSKFTAKEFTEILYACPIRFYDSIGVDFS